MTNSDNGQKDDWSRYGKLIVQLWERTIEPMKHPEYVIYFIVVMGMIGPMNFWMELIRYHLTEPETSVTLTQLRTTILTFFPAIAMGAAMQIVVAEDGKPLKVFAIFLGAVTVFIAYVLFQKGIGDCRAILVGSMMSALSLWIWWIANAKQADLFDKRDPDDPVGGDTTRKLSGSTEGMNV